MDTDSAAIRTAKTLQKLGIGIELSGFWHAELFLPNRTQTIANITKESLIGKSSGVETLFDRSYDGCAFPNPYLGKRTKAIKGWELLSPIVELDLALSTINLRDLMFWFDVPAFELGRILDYIQGIDVGSSASGGIAIWLTWNPSGEAIWSYEIQCIDTARKGFKGTFLDLIQTMYDDTQRELMPID